MGKALYRKYRSKSLAEIVGQEHITQTLSQAIKDGHISHAYLFTGTRGVGKTSVARILAHQINGLPYTDDSMAIDIIEIDAASNRRIDEIRDLRDKVYIAPVQARYKVYIIDEVHMLTREAFNALLKTLEEPPAHVVFILATTEAHKLPETIVSRTQHFTFRPIESSKVIAHLKSIAAKEHISITDDALELIAEHGGGIMRDSVGLLDQASGQSGSVDVPAVQALLGIPPKQAIEELSASIEQGSDVHAAISALNELYNQGFQAAAIAKQLAAILRSQLITSAYAGEIPTATALLASLLEVPVSHDPERFLEIVILRAMAKPAILQTSKQPPAKRPNNTQPTSKAAQAAKPTEFIATDPIPTAKEAETTIESPTAEPLTSFDETTWMQVLATLKKHYNTLYSIARMADPRITDNGGLELVFAFAFHQKRLSEAKNRKIISDAIAEVTGQQIEFSCSLDPTLKLSQRPAVTATAPLAENNPLSTISNIFGGGEVLNS